MNSRVWQIGFATFALIVAALVRRHLAPRLPSTLGRAQRLALVFGALAGAAVFAKVPFLFDDLEATRSGLVWLSDGRTLTWGLVGGYLGVEIAKLLSGVRIGTGDSFAPAVSAALAVGRLGCFFGGCCRGTETHLPWGIDFGDGVFRHPTQLYEAAFHASAFSLLVWLDRRGWIPSHRMKAYAIAYFVFRFATEWIRPEPRGALGLTFYQWSALAFIVLFAAHWMLSARAREGSAAEPAALDAHDDAAPDAPGSHRR